MQGQVSQGFRFLINLGQLKKKKLEMSIAVVRSVMYVHFVSPVCNSHLASEERIPQQLDSPTLLLQ